MRNKKVKACIIVMLIIMILCTSPVYAAYTFKPGPNIITIDEYKAGVDFQVLTTGVYAINLLPSDEDIKWHYTITSLETNKDIPLALVHDGEDENKKPIYKLYSSMIPYVYLKADTKGYCIKISNAKTNTLCDTDEKYVTVNLSTPITNEENEYYEGTNALDSYSSSSNNDVPDQLDVSDSTPQDSDVKKCSGVLGEEPQSDFMQKLLTYFFVYVVGDGIMFLVGVVAGEPLTIEKILFNGYSNTRLSLFEKTYTYTDAAGNTRVNADKVNSLLVKSGLIGEYGTVNKFYNRFMLIAFISYLITLLYMGIRIALSSTGKDAAKYKKLFADWVVGVLILCVFPYVMRYAILINDGIVSYIKSLKDTVGVGIEAASVADHPGGLAFPFSYAGSNGGVASDYMAEMRLSALKTGRIMYALCWLMMIKELISFLIIYIKRLLTTMFLIVIFPLVMISYAIDKIGDGKSQAFNNWCKEFILNVFLQSFHALNYVIVMGLIFAVGKTTGQVNFVLLVIGHSYLAQGDKILRGLFSHLKGGGGGTVKDVAATTLATMGAVQVAKSSVATIRNAFGNVGKARAASLKARESYSKLSEYKTQNKWDQWSLSSGYSDPVGGGDTDGQAPVIAQPQTRAETAASIALDPHASAEQIKEAVGKLQESAMAPEGSNEKRNYDEMMDRLEAEGRAGDLKGIMNYSSAVDTIQNAGKPNVLETDIGMSLNILINTKRSGNVRKLTANLDRKAFSDKRLKEMQKLYKKREIDDEGRTRVNKVKTSLCTKDDAEKLTEIGNIDRRIAEIEAEPRIKARRMDPTGFRRTERYETEAQHLRKKANRLQNETTALQGQIDRMENRSGKKSAATRNQIGQMQRELAAKKIELNVARTSSEDLTRRANEFLGQYATPTEAETQELVHLRAKRTILSSKVSNKNLTPSSVAAGHDKNAKVSEYLSGVGGDSASDELKRIATARAIYDGRNSGQYTITEIWEATQTVKNAESTTAPREEIRRVLEIRNSTAPSAGNTILTETDEFTDFNTYIAGIMYANPDMVAKEVRNTEKKKEIQEQAKETLIVSNTEEGVSQHILDAVGLKVIGEDNDLEHATVKKLETDSKLLDEIKAAQAERDREVAKAKKVDGKPVVDAYSERLMKKNLARESVDLAGTVIKAATTPIVITTSTLASAGMYAGASGDYSVTNAVATAGAVSGSVEKLNNRIINAATVKTGKFAEKIAGKSSSSSNQTEPVRLNPTGNLDPATGSSPTANLNPTIDPTDVEIRSMMDVRREDYSSDEEYEEIAKIREKIEQERKTEEAMKRVGMSRILREREEQLRRRNPRP